MLQDMVNTQCDFHFGALSHTTKKTHFIEVDVVLHGIQRLRFWSKHNPRTSELWRLPSRDKIQCLGSVTDRTAGMDSHINEESAMQESYSSNWRTFQEQTWDSSIIKPILLNGSETWRTIKTTVIEVQTFIDSCLSLIASLLGQCFIKQRCLCYVFRHDWRASDVFGLLYCYWSHYNGIINCWCCDNCICEWV